MQIDELREYCLSKKGVTEDLPFGPDTLVFRIGGKMFALIGLNDPDPRINLKCDPERAVELRMDYDSIIPGYHMSKKLWNTVYTANGLEEELITELIDHSYSLILNGLPKAVQKEIAESEG